MSLDEIRHIHKKTPVQVNHAIKNKKCKQTARGNQNFYWDGGEKYPRKSSISTCLGGFEKQRWTHGGKNGAGKDPEKGTQREFSRGPPEPLELQMVERLPLPTTQLPASAGRGRREEI